MTFRMRGHEEASGTKYIPKETLDYWSKLDPVSNYEKYLLEEKVISSNDINIIREDIQNEINRSWKKSELEQDIIVDSKNELKDVYKMYVPEIIEEKGSKSNKRLVDAISDGLKQSMEKYNNLIIVGQDIAEYGGVFKVTDNFVNLFGKARRVQIRQWSTHRATGGVFRILRFTAWSFL